MGRTPRVVALAALCALAFVWLPAAPRGENASQFLVPLPDPFPDPDVSAGEDGVCLGDHLFVQDGKLVRNVTLYLRTRAALGQATLRLPPDLRQVRGRTLLPDGKVFELPAEAVLRTRRETVVSFLHASAPCVVMVQFTQVAVELDDLATLKQENLKNPLIVRFGWPLRTKTATVHFPGQRAPRLTLHPRDTWVRLPGPEEAGVSYLASGLPACPVDEEGASPCNGPERPFVAFGLYRYDRYFRDDLGTWDGLAHALALAWRQPDAAERAHLTKWFPREAPPGAPAEERFREVRERLAAVPDLTRAEALAAFRRRHLPVRIALLQEPGAPEPPENLPGLTWFDGWAVAVELDSGLRYFFPGMPGIPDERVPPRFAGGRAWLISDTSPPRWTTLPATPWETRESWEVSVTPEGVHGTWRLTGAAAAEAVPPPPFAGEADFEPGWREEAAAKWASLFMRDVSLTVTFTPSLPGELNAAWQRPAPMPGPGWCAPWSIAPVPFLRRIRAGTPIPMRLVPWTWTETVLLPEGAVAPAPWAESAGEALAAGVQVQARENRIAVIRELRLSGAGWNDRTRRDGLRILARLEAMNAWSVPCPECRPESPSPAPTVGAFPEQAALAITVRDPDVRHDEALQAWIFQADAEQAPILLKEKPRAWLTAVWSFPAARRFRLDGGHLQFLSSLLDEPSMKRAVLSTPRTRKDAERRTRWQDKVLGTPLVEAKRMAPWPGALQALTVPLPYDGAPFEIRADFLASSEFALPAVPLAAPLFSPGEVSITVQPGSAGWRPWIEHAEALAAEPAWTNARGERSCVLSGAWLDAKAGKVPRLRIAPSRVNWDGTERPCATWDDLAALVRALAKLPAEPEGPAGAAAGERAQPVFEQVRGALRYVDVGFGLRGYVPRTAGETETSGWGDCKDTSVLLAARLREAGLPAELAFAAVRSEVVPDPGFPSLGWFDHQFDVVPIQEGDLFFDATCKPGEGDPFSPRLIGKRAWIASDPPRFVSVPGPADTGSWEVHVRMGAVRDGIALVDVEEISTAPFRMEEQHRWLTASNPERLRQVRSRAHAFLPGAFGEEDGSVYLDEAGRLHVHYRFHLAGLTAPVALDPRGWPWFSGSDGLGAAQVRVLVTAPPGHLLHPAEGAAADHVELAWRRADPPPAPVRLSAP